MSSTVHRREVLKRLALGGAGAAACPAWVEALSRVAQAQPTTRSAAGDSWQPKVLTKEQNETLIELSELIIPQTETAGAKAARVNEFIDTVLDDAEEAERQHFLDGLDWLDERSFDLFGAPFVHAKPDQQTALLTILSSESNQTTSDRTGVEFFQAMKQLTVDGYYTSEIAIREELGEDTELYFDDDPGCQHPEHQGGTTDAGGQP